MRRVESSPGISPTTYCKVQEVAVTQAHPHDPIEAMQDIHQSRKGWKNRKAQISPADSLTHFLPRRWRRLFKSFENEITVSILNVIKVSSCQMSIRDEMRGKIASTFNEFIFTISPSVSAILWFIRSSSREAKPSPVDNRGTGFCFKFCPPFFQSQRFWKCREFQYWILSLSDLFWLFISQLVADGVKTREVSRFTWLLFPAKWGKCKWREVSELLCTYIQTSSLPLIWSRQKEPGPKEHFIINRFRSWKKGLRNLMAIPGQ